MDKTILRPSGRMVLIIVGTFFLLCHGMVMSQELTIPYVFSPGNVISSFEMNENFRVIADKANALDSVINNLDASNSFWGYNSGTLTYSGGNVGIGTTSPVSPFTVAKDDGLTDGVHILSTIYKGQGQYENAGVSLGYYAAGGNETGGYIRAEDDLPLMLGTMGVAQAVTILTNGYVGIGETSPDTRLHLKGSGWLNSSLTLQNSTGDTGAELRIQNEKGAFYLTVTGDGDAIVNSKGTGKDLHLRTEETTRMTITSVGNFGIGETNPSAMLHVEGNIRCTSLNETSDIRYKSDIRTIPNALERVGKLRGVNFTWKDEEKFGSGEQIGIVAQEIEEVFPEAVTSDSEGNKSVAYSKLTAVLIEAVKELKTENEELRKRIEQLED